jgi:hypothetical protein
VRKLVVHKKLRDEVIKLAAASRSGARGEGEELVPTLLEYRAPIASLAFALHEEEEANGSLRTTAG